MRLWNLTDCSRMRRHLAVIRGRHIHVAPPSRVSLDDYYDMASCGRANRILDLIDFVNGKTALTCVLANYFLVCGSIDAVNLVAGHIAVQPLDVRSEAIDYCARFLGYSLEISLS